MKILPTFSRLPCASILVAAITGTLIFAITAAARDIVAIPAHANGVYPASGKIQWQILAKEFGYSFGSAPEGVMHFSKSDEDFNTETQRTQRFTEGVVKRPTPDAEGLCGFDGTHYFGVSPLYLFSVALCVLCVSVFKSLKMHDTLQSLNVNATVCFSLPQGQWDSDQTL